MEVPRLNRLMKKEGGAILQGVVGDIHQETQIMTLRGRPGEYQKGNDGKWHQVEKAAIPIMNMIKNLVSVE